MTARSSEKSSAIATVSTSLSSPPSGRPRPRRATAGRGHTPGYPPAATFGLASTHPPVRSRCASLASDRRCVGPHNVCWGVPWSRGNRERCVNSQVRGKRTVRCRGPSAPELETHEGDRLLLHLAGLVLDEALDDRPGPEDLDP